MTAAAPACSVFSTDPDPWRGRATRVANSVAACSAVIKIGRLAGIPISIHPLWLVIVALITWSLGSTYYPDQVSGIAPAAAYALGLVSALLLFASILLHELGHAVVARRYGVEIEGIELWLLGGVAKMKGAAHPARRSSASRSRDRRSRS